MKRRIWVAILCIGMSAVACGDPDPRSSSPPGQNPSSSETVETEPEPSESTEPEPSESTEAEPKELIDDGVVTIRPKRVRPGDTMTIVIEDPPGFFGLGWYLERQDGSEWTYIGGYRAGPPGQWEDHDSNRFYFLPTWLKVGLEDTGFDGNDSIDLKVPRLEPGTYRISGTFLVDHDDEWHVDVFEVIEP